MPEPKRPASAHYSAASQLVDSAKLAYAADSAKTWHAPVEAENRANPAIGMKMPTLPNLLAQKAAVANSLGTLELGTLEHSGAVRLDLNANVNVVISLGSPGGGNGGSDSAKLDLILAALGSMRTELLDRLKEILMDEAIVKATLEHIDATTTAIGGNVGAIGTNVASIGANVTSIATVAGTISDEIDALKEAMKKEGVSQALIDQAAGISQKSDAIELAAESTAAAAKQTAEGASALVPVLEGIAAKGQLTPPAVVPPAPAPVPAPVVP